VVAEQPPGFDSQEQPVPLPRGRSNLSPEEVAEHQRERVIVGVSTVLAEGGYGDLTVEKVISAARISRTTFYELFADKREAALFTQETLFGRLLTAIRDACDGQKEWPQKVKAAIEATVDFAEARPAQARLIAAEFLSGDPIHAARARASHEQLANLLAEGRKCSPRGAALPAVTEQALIGALRSLIMRGLALEETERLALRSEMVELTLIPYVGRTQAAAVVGQTR
jgi:AcrR family transcriptional regulator